MRTFIKLILGAALLMTLAVGIGTKIECDYREFDIKKYKLKVDVNFYCYQAFMPMMPGSSGDKSGVVRLIDEGGDVVAESDVAMVSLVYDLVVTDTMVKLPLHFTWEPVTALSVDE